MPRAKLGRSKKARDAEEVTEGPGDAPSGFGTTMAEVRGHVSALSAELRCILLDAQAAGRLPPNADELARQMTMVIQSWSQEHTGRLAAWQKNMNSQVRIANNKALKLMSEVDRSQADIAQAQAALHGTLRSDAIAIDPSGFFVYCLWGDDIAKPLYVGQSTNLLSRLGTHMQNPDRRWRIRRITATRCVTASEMDETEARLIRLYQPELNVIGKGL